MKKAICSVLVFMFVLCAFSACAVKPEKAILGTWEGTKELMIGEAKYTFTFYEDGTGVMSTPGIDLGVTMTYTVTEDTLTVVTSVLGISNTNTYTMTFGENTLTLTNDEDTIQLTKVQ